MPHTDIIERRSYGADWARADRAKNPDKYRAKGRARYAKKKAVILQQVKASAKRRAPQVKATKAARYRSQDPRARRNDSLIRLYGIGIDEYESMYVDQNGSCAICGEKRDKLHVDHCHTTDVVRGLLCDGCNKGIGFFQDDPHRLANAAKYLNKGK